MPLYLGNISKYWLTDNMKKKTGFNGQVYDFSVDYDATDVDDIKDIHKYLMKKQKQNGNENIWIVKKVFLIRLIILSRFTNAIPLNCISVKNQ